MIYKRCLLQVQCEVFPINLMELPLGEVDLILGMDWLCEHRVILYYDSKRVTFWTSSGNEIIMVGEHQNYLTNVIFALVVEKLVRKGYDAYLAYILDINVDSVELKNIHMVKEFLDVFLEELLDLPLERETEFEIELMFEITPVSIAPYLMTLKELKELKAQLQELLDSGIIKPSVSLWGALVLFVKKKDEYMRLCFDYR